MLGNDVVDLRDPESRPESFRPRFEERVFTPEERRAIERDRDPMARRWAHWAAKEAAYKLARQVDPGFVFAPGRFQIHFETPDHGAGRRLERRGFVEWLGSAPQTKIAGLDRLEVRSDESEERVHVIALPEGGDWGAVDFAVETIEEGETDLSAAVRRLAIRGLSRNLGVARHRLSIGRRRLLASVSESSTEAVAEHSQRRVPTVEIDGEQTDLSLSLSHHGRWLSYSMIPRVHALLVQPEKLERGVTRTGVNRS